MNALRVAMVAPYPAGAVLPSDRVKPKYRQEHAAPWVRALCGALAKRTDVVFRVFVHSRAVTAHAEGEEHGVSYTFIPKREPYRTDPFHLYWPARLAVLPHVRAFRPDVVHGFGTESCYGVLATAQPAPSVVFIQGIMARYAPFLDFPRAFMALARHIERDVARRATLLVAETNFARDWALEVAPHARVRLIPHAANPEFLGVAPDFTSPTLLAIGGLDRRKGIDTILRAFARCAGPRDRLRIVGDGASRSAYESLAAGLGIADKVHFTGNLNRDGVLRELAGARALVIGSRMDTSPNVVTEAHAAGLPVVGTRAGGIPEMIDDGQDGLLVPVDDPAAMADAIAPLLRDPDLCSRMGGAGRKKVAELNDPDRIAQLHVECYRVIVGAR